MDGNRRLSRALDALSRERKRRQRELAEVQSRRARISAAIGRLERCREVSAATAVVSEDGEFDADLYLVVRTAEARMSREIEGLEQRLQTFDRDVTSQVEERLRTSAVRERAVETLVARQKTTAQKEQERRETRQMDEHAQNRWRTARGQKPK